MLASRAIVLTVIALVGAPAIPGVSAAHAQDAERRPLYVIAHRINDAADVEAALRSGANAIECDVRRGRITPFHSPDWFVDHDGTFTWSTRLDDWLDAAARAARANPEQFAVIIFDIKTPQNLAGLLRRARAKLPANLNLVFSIAEYADRGAFDAIRGSLGPHDGLAIDFDNDPRKIQAYFTGAGVRNFWYGNGIFVAGVGPNVESSVAQAAALRDAEGTTKKVYVWTLERSSSIERYFRVHQVDGVFVNPGTIPEAVRIARAHGRLASRSDPAWEVFRPGAARAAPTVASAAGAVCAPDRPAQVPIEAGAYYRLTTAWRGEGLSLDIRNDGRNNNVPILAPTGDYSGQHWKLAPVAGGYYRLTTAWRGDGMSLDIVNDGRNDNQPILARTGNYTGQFWQLTPTGNGHYRLTTAWQGGCKALDVINDGRTNTSLILAPGGNYTGQFWKLTRVR